jgi:hypothetical protein
MKFEAVYVNVTYFLSSSVPLFILSLAIAKTPADYLDARLKCPWLLKD